MTAPAIRAEEIAPDRKRSTLTPGAGKRTARFPATQTAGEAEEATLRARKKIRVREELVRVATELFARKGFEATTMEEIARAAEVSRRTAFRYFPAKELLLFPHHEPYFDQFRRLVVETRRGETAFAAVRRALTSLAAEYMRDRAGHLEQQRIIERSATLIARGNEFDEQWEDAIAARLAAGLSEPAGRRRARYLAGAIMGVTITTMREWYRDECRGDLVEMGQEALSLIEPVSRLGQGALRNRK